MRWLVMAMLVRPALTLLGIRKKEGKKKEHPHEWTIAVDCAWSCLWSTWKLTASPECGDMGSNGCAGVCLCDSPAPQAALVTSWLSGWINRTSYSYKALHGTGPDYLRGLLYLIISAYLVRLGRMDIYLDPSIKQYHLSRPRKPQCLSSRIRYGSYPGDVQKVTENLATLPCFEVEWASSPFGFVIVMDCCLFYLLLLLFSFKVLTHREFL